MTKSEIEPIIASPPEREELVIQLFVREGGQWGEVFRENGEFWIELYRSAGDPPLRFLADEFISTLSLFLNELRRRLE